MLTATEIDHLIVTLFAIFYIDDAYLVSCDPEFLRFACVGLETYVQKTQTTNAPRG
jgi:hypothetical protein